jgi:hypothetical protein
MVIHARGLDLFQMSFPLWDNRTRERRKVVRGVGGGLSIALIVCRRCRVGIVAINPLSMDVADNAGLSSLVVVELISSMSAEPDS